MMFFGILKVCNRYVFKQSELLMKKLILLLISVVWFMGYLNAAVQPVIIDNQSGIDITVLIQYQDRSQATHIISAKQKTPFYTEDKCLRGITIYSGRWTTVDDLEHDDKLVIPVSWDRCQGWSF